MNNHSFALIVTGALLASCTNTVDLSAFKKPTTKNTSNTQTASIQKQDAKIPDYKIPNEKQANKPETPPQKKSTSNPSKGMVLAYKPPQIGTVFTWRNNWANLPTTISYKVSDIRTLGSTEYVIFKSTAGFKNETRAFYDTKNFSLKGYRDANDKALVTYKPVEGRYRFPMKPGDQWVTSWKSIEHKSKEVTVGGGVVSVVKQETLKLPAGVFNTLKLKMPVQKNAPRGLTHHVWFAPELGITVKEEIGGGSLNWFQTLEKVERPSITVSEN